MDQMRTSGRHEPKYPTLEAARPRRGFAAPVASLRAPELPKRQPIAPKARPEGERSEARDQGDWLDGSDAYLRNLS